MKYYAVFLPMKDEEKSRKYRKEHLDFLSERRKAKDIFINGRFVDGTGGLVIYTGESLEEVEAMVKQDPYIIQGARDYSIHEWEMVTSNEN